MNISDSGKDGPSQKLETKRRVYLGFFPRIRRRSYRKTVASIRRTMCPPLPILISDHNASRQCAPQKPPMGWISSRRFPGWWRNIAQVIGFVRGPIKGQVVREQNDQKTSLQIAEEEPLCNTHMLHTAWILIILGIAMGGTLSNGGGGCGCETSHLWIRPMRNLRGVAPHTSPPIAANRPPLPATLQGGPASRFYSWCWTWHITMVEYSVHCLQWPFVIYVLSNFAR